MGAWSERGENAAMGKVFAPFKNSKVTVGRGTPKRREGGKSKNQGGRIGGRRKDCEIHNWVHEGDFDDDSEATPSRNKVSFIDKRKALPRARTETVPQPVSLLGAKVKSGRDDARWKNYKARPH